MPTAYLHLPAHVAERREAFAEGSKKNGFRLHYGEPTTPLRPQDLVITWNLTSRSRLSAHMAQAGGGAHIVCENGYAGEDADGHQYYAMALDGHCGSGRWYAPDDSRLRKLGLDFQPWRNTRTHRVLIAGQRGIGTPQMKSPVFWAEKTQAELARKRYAGVIRPHPGKDSHHAPPLLEQLEGMDALVVWSSNCATAALIAGVPTFYAAPHIITAGAAAKIQHLGMHNFTDEAREAAFSRMAWAQWTLAEIASGEAIKTLLDVHKGRLPAVQKP